MTLDVLDRDGGGLQRSPLPLNDRQTSCQVRLELAPGSDTLQVVARDENGVRAWIEAPAQPGEQLTVDFQLTVEGALRVVCQNRPFLFLPSDDPPPPLLLTPHASEELDLVVLVDGTCLHPSPTAAGLDYLLSPSLAEPWQAIVARLTDFLSRVSEKHPRLWAMAAAFGDEKMEMLSNPLLRPTYLVHPQIPEKRKLEPARVDQITAQLLDLPSTPGGDFMDALADGLRACRNARWRQNSRKLLVVFGHSPGYSVLDTRDDMTNLLVREACIEEETAELHRSGVEVVTLFHDPKDSEEMYSGAAEEALSFSRNQYRQLASLPEWFGETSTFDPAAMAASWLNRPSLLARGASPGLLA